MMSLALSLLVLQNEGKYQDALARFSRDSRSLSPTERADACLLLGRATFDKADRTTAEKLTAQILNELANAKGSKPDSEASGLVLEACMEGLGFIKDEKAVEWLIKGFVSNKTRGEREKFYVTIALGPIPGDAAGAAIRDVLAAPSLNLQIAALEAFGRRKDPKTLPDVLGALKKGATWEIKAAAISAVRRIGDKEQATLLALVDELQRVVDAFRNGDPNLEGRLQDDLVAVLRDLTGKDAGYLPEQWRRIVEGKERSGGTEIIPVEFFGIKTRSTRIIFMIDKSGSMDAAASDKIHERLTGDLADKLPAKWVEGLSGAEQKAFEECKKLREKWVDVKVSNRMQAVQKELIQTVYLLAPEVTFTIFMYDHGVYPWSDARGGMLKADWMNKFKAMRNVENTGPAGGTNYWDTLKTGFEYSNNPKNREKGKPTVLSHDRKFNYALGLDGADTFFLLSDGEPTAGQIVDKVVMQGELRKLNLLRRTIINTICVGDEDPLHPEWKVDPNFLEKIANENSGTFKHVTEKKP